MTAVAPKTGASFARGASKQEVETPPEFIDAVVRKFGPLDVDLAATLANAKADRFISPDVDSLKADWLAWIRGNAWLNPPFSKIDPWAKKCAETAPFLPPAARILLLVPASVGANWFAEHVHGHALVLALQGRIKFVGHDSGFPKDLVLAVYGVGLRGFDLWKWGTP